MGPLIDGWQHYVLQDFTGSTGGPLSFVFLALAADLSNLYVDDVSINAVPGGNIPEPGSLLLVGAALAAGAMVRRRTQQRF